MKPIKPIDDNDRVRSWDEIQIRPYRVVGWSKHKWIAKRLIQWLGSLRFKAEKGYRRFWIKMFDNRFDRPDIKKPDPVLSLVFIILVYMRTNPSAGNWWYAVAGFVFIDTLQKRYINRGIKHAGYALAKAYYWCLKRLIKQMGFGYYKVVINNHNDPDNET